VSGACQLSPFKLKKALSLSSVQWHPLGMRVRSGAYILLAIGLHALLLRISFPELNLNDSLESLKEKAIEIVSSKDLSLNKQVVQTSQLEKQEDKGQIAQFNAEAKNRVEQETRSPFIGSFQQGIQSPEIPEPEREDETGDESHNESTKDSAVPLKKLLTFGRSPHALPKDIPLGNQTVLNTDKVRYASFINRIADEIYQPWVESAERAVRDFLSGNRKIEANLYITRLKITLDPEGSVKAIQVLESSGISELDEAPKKAFWEAEPFPNPPSQLLENDGFVRLTYEFQFEWKNSAFNIIPWKI